jgi:hypothetical protein
MDTIRDEAAKLQRQLEREAQMNIIRAKSEELGRLLRRTEAARYVTDNYFPCSPKTLAKLACVSSLGPPFRRAGRIPMYPVSGLDEWAQSKIGPLVRSTSEVRHPIS